MSSSFVAVDATQYEQMMGRFSRLLARQFIAFAGLRDEERVVDVGCGTGNLTFELLEAAQGLSLTGIDYSPVFLAAARAKPGAAAITFEQGDAAALPFADASFDRALSLLVLHFVPEARRAVAEMRRVVRSGGVAAAAVWDASGGFTTQRMFWDTLAGLLPSAEAGRAASSSRPLTRPGEMRQAFIEAGLIEVDETTLTIRMDYARFDDFWAPIAGGEGPLGAYLSRLTSDERKIALDAVKRAYEGGAPDGPRSFAASAWACRARVP
jgi:ubiquinone/menaquinone biosynthesis C-methylase UbiE